jgi:hypothetical protein
MSGFKVPYLDWIICNTKIYEFNSKIIYNLGDIATIGTSVYRSLVNNNVGHHPSETKYWFRIV